MGNSMYIPNTSLSGDTWQVCRPQQKSLPEENPIYFLPYGRGDLERGDLIFAKRQDTGDIYPIVI